MTETRWVRAWAYRVVTRAAVRAAKGERHRAFVAFEDLPELAAPTVEELAIGSEFAQELRERLSALPPAARVVLRMHYLDDLTLPEIASALEIPLGTVKSRLAYGLAAMREELARSGRRFGTPVRP